MTINHKLRLMKMLGIHGKRRKNEKYHSYKGEVGKVFEKLATEVTQLKVGDTKVYLSPIMDLYNNEIMAYLSVQTLHK